MTLKQTWFDRALGVIAPTTALRRTRARLATELLQRHYEAASVGRRTQGWRRTAGDANAVNAKDLATLREHARDLARNNGQMAQALRTIANHTVGWGIVAKAVPANEHVANPWRVWAETTECDADGRTNLAGLQKLVMRTVAESGECLVRRRWRRIEDGYAIPMQLQVLEPDHLDTNKNGALPGGGQIINGVEFDALGERVAYWLFPTHPGASNGRLLFEPAKRYPAADILHVFERTRPGQVRAVSWFAPIILPAKDLDEYGDAQLMKQKIAACLSVITTDVDGSGAPLGEADDTSNPGTDMLEPGAIIQAKPGQSIEVVQPPAVNDYAAFTTVENRKLAKGLGLTYEDYTGDYSGVNFSSARMARLSHYENVHDWRWLMLVPQFCDPVWAWAMEAMQVMGLPAAGVRAEWTAPGMPMIEPDKEGLAIMRNARAGIQTIPEAIRERGYDPDAVLAEYKDWNTKIDAAGVVLDSDPRKVTQAGQLQGSSASVGGANGGQSNG